MSKIADTDCVTQQCSDSVGQNATLNKIWTAVECNGAIYCTVVTSYCPRPKLLLKPSYFPKAFRTEGWVEGVIFGRGQYDVIAVQ